MNTTKEGSHETVVRVCSTGGNEPLQFEVVVQNGSGATHYQVTMSKSDFERLSQRRATAEECVRAAFLFLLDREPKEFILRRFDVSIIGRYFPDFVRDFPHYRDRK